MSDKRRDEKLEYAVELIETVSAQQKAPIQILENALTIMEFGGISPREMLNYLEAVGK
jgi:hypothetical protein